MTPTSSCLGKVEDNDDEEEEEEEAYDDTEKVERLGKVDDSDKKGEDEEANDNNTEEVDISNNPTVVSLLVGSHQLCSHVCGI